MTVYKRWSWGNDRFAAGGQAQGRQRRRGETRWVPCREPKPVPGPWTGKPWPRVPRTQPFLPSPCCRLCCREPSETWPARWEPCRGSSGEQDVLLWVFPFQLAADGGGTSYLSSSPLSVSSTFCRLLPLSRANSLTSEPSTRRLSPSCPSSTARHSSPSLLP